MAQKLEDALKNLVLHNYNEFTAFDKIGEGYFGTVYKSKWKDRSVALKCLKFDTKPGEKELQQFVRELQLLQKISRHPNIIEFYGVTKNPSEEEYKIILQFAEDGNLRDYLKKQFSSLKWADKLRIATEIASGLNFLHDNNIAHRDLHPRNILVHQGTMMIADFGISKQINEAPSSNSAIFGTPAYVEPQCLEDPDYIRDKKSDIYSFGFILWEISSGKEPFQSIRSADAIQILIYQGKREQPVDGTPEQYIRLYTDCWDDNPAKRPDIKKVLEVLEDLNNVHDSQDISSHYFSNIDPNASINGNSSKID
ncbi:kinase-like protein [Gigaspora margarita]|uniref:Kinase-like protein n=1 Tax=Gigaspora margarita TaxID=4874 RepID=A0A8H3XI71_GIGMA|nr:kinase-like protein [Gigaspora margarita]